MRRALPFVLLSACLSLFNTSGLRAQNDRFAYAITDVAKDGSVWSVLRKLDLKSGQYSDILLNGMDAKSISFDATTKKQVQSKIDPQYGSILQTPFATGVAAAAYDKKHNRLYFTPMFVDQLRYIDLSSMKVYYVTEHSFTNLGNMHNDEGKIVTRMVIDPDGNGYAITNDANTFVRFSTGKKSTKIEQLGALVDDPVNGSTSVHNRCSSYGGDMISDDRGNLYILSARNNVFRVNTQTKVATLLGYINGLTPNFTVNGAVVDGEGKLLVSSAVDGSSYFQVNPKDWSATPYQLPNGVFRSSDLANSNFLASPKKASDILKYTEAEIQKMIRPTDKFAQQIAVYPNPVTNSKITVQFNKVPNGNYTVELRDVLGRSVFQKKITINSENQVQGFQLNESNAKGVYMIKVFDNFSQSVFTQKVVVQ